MNITQQASFVCSVGMNAPVPVNRDTPSEGDAHTKEGVPQKTEGEVKDKPAAELSSKAKKPAGMPSKKTAPSDMPLDSKIPDETAQSSRIIEREGAPSCEGVSDSEPAAAAAPAPELPTKAPPKKTKKNLKPQSTECSDTPPSIPLAGDGAPPTHHVDEPGALKDHTSGPENADEGATRNGEAEPFSDERPGTSNAVNDLDTATGDSNASHAAVIASKKKEDDARLAKDLESEQDEEVRLAMEMALAAAQHPHLSPVELQKLVGEKNKQSKIVEELARQKEEKLKEQQEREREESARAWQARKDSWWAAAAKKAEEIKDQAERHLYADQIKKDREIIETRKKMKSLKKVLKAHRLQGNRVETRHAFKRQKMEKKLLQTEAKLKRTQKMFTHSNYNVQEYLKAMMKASKKWRKKGTDDELMLEAQLCRNMHQMLALEKQKVKTKKETKEMKKYLQRCKGWLSDKKAFCEMNLMTLEATQHSMMLLYEDTLRRQDALIAKLKALDEFKGVDLSDVDLSHVVLPKFATSREPESLTDAMRGLPINDSIRVKKSQDSAKDAPDSDAWEPPLTDEHKAEQIKAHEDARSRQILVQQYHAAKRKEAEAAAGGQPELYVETGDACSVSSRLSDPDGSFNMEGEESDSNFDFGRDAPWMASHSASVESAADSTDDEDMKPAANIIKRTRTPSSKDSPSTDSETPPPSESRVSGELVAAS